MAILLIPLDDRPCCTQFVQRVAAMAGRRVAIPSEIGNFLTPGQPVKLMNSLKSAQEMLVSLDMLAWGGLVASRAQTEPFAQVLNRMTELPQIVEGKRAHAFQSIMRTAPTQTSPEEVKLAERLVELSVLSARKDPRADELALGLPEDYLTAYLDRRDQAHQLNRLAMGQAYQGTWQSLLLGVDDSRTEGWNVLEIQALSRHLPDNATIAPGTDEMALLQLVRLIGPAGPVKVRWFPQECQSRVGLYEDRSLFEVVDAQARAAGVELRESNRQLWVYGPTGNQGEAATQIMEDGSRAEAFLAALRQGLDAGLQIALADVAHANGGDLRLLDDLVASGLAHHLVNYAGWNTAGNTLGTALSALALWPDQPSPAQDEARLHFLAERLLDDGYYQASIRPSLGTTALKDAGAAVASTVKAELETRLARLIAVGFPSTGLQVSLPWNRVFEVRVELA